MPATHNAPAAAQEPASLNNENAAVHRAYRMIGQLRQHSPAQSPLSQEARVTLDWPAAEREAHRVRAAGIFISRNPETTIREH
jgi:hypothetical protein